MNTAAAHSAQIANAQIAATLAMTHLLERGAALMYISNGMACRDRPLIALYPNRLTQNLKRQGAQLVEEFSGVIGPQRLYRIEIGDCDIEWLEPISVGAPS